MSADRDAAKRQESRIERTAREAKQASAETEALLAEFVRALDLHKERIRRLQAELCECHHPEFFQAELHEEACPVYEIAAEMREEYQPRA